MNRQSQCTQILQFIRRHGSITSWQAFKRLRITRLSGRIYDLKKRGYRIKPLMVKRGRNCFVRYSMQ